MRRSFSVLRTPSSAFASPEAGRSASGAPSAAATAAADRDPGAAPRSQWRTPEPPPAITTPMLLTTASTGTRGPARRRCPPRSGRSRAGAESASGRRPTAREARRRRRRVRRRERLRDVVAVVKVFIDRLRISGNLRKPSFVRFEPSLPRVSNSSAANSPSKKSSATRATSRRSRRGSSIEGTAGAADVCRARRPRRVPPWLLRAHRARAARARARLRGVPTLCGAQRPAVPVRARLGLVEGAPRNAPPSRRDREGAPDRRRDRRATTRTALADTRLGGSPRVRAERRRPGPSGAAQVLREPEPEHDRGLVSFPRVLAFVPSLLSTGSFPLPRGAQDRAERQNVDHVRGAAQTQARHVQQRHRPLARELKQGRFVFPGSPPWAA